MYDTVPSVHVNSDLGYYTDVNWQPLYTGIIIINNHRIPISLQIQTKQNQRPIE